ncbi:ABC transporter substrate-binding protein [Desulfocarbo indianensis]|nr:ABC transporter substrate-binding protein [Desulfocarbo indianensis]
MAKRILASISGFLISLLVCGALAQARQITDMTGRQVTVPEVINKVYATAPPATYMVYAVAPEALAGINAPHPAGVEKYLTPQARILPVLGGWFGQGRSPNLESLLQARPDVVVAFRLSGNAAGWKIEEALRPLGLPLVNLNMDRMGDYPATLRFIGKLLKREARAEELARYADATLAAMASLRASLTEAEKVTIYYAEGAQGLYTECSASMHAELIALCGGINLHRCDPSSVYGMEKISLEQVIQHNPQVILTHNPMFYQTVKADPRWMNLRAVRNGRIYRIPCQPLNWFDRPPSFMRLLGAHWLARRLYPQRYQLDIVSETRKFIRLFFGKEIDENAARELLEQ